MITKKIKIQVDSVNLHIYNIINYYTINQNRDKLLTL